jgi:CheY-like chemotaxis protein
MVTDVLVIDDDAAMRRLVARVLGRAGHQVHQAADGREGIDLFRRRRPALVICDIVMPVTEGIETIRTLRREAPAVPIIAISGSNVPLYLRAALELGAVTALEKPFSAAALLAAVGALLDTAPEPCKRGSSAAKTG